MRDSLGGTVIIAIIVFFLSVASGYLAYNVNYMKAFNMKNKIISIYNKYDGVCDPKNCGQEISDYAKSIGYHNSNLVCDKEGNKKGINDIYCYKFVKAVKSGEKFIWADGTEYYYYTIMTKVDINLPIINTLGFSVQTLSGDTSLFKCNKSGGCDY